MGGNVPLGYDVRERKLVVNAGEAETVRSIFRCYVELGSVRLLRDELDRRGIVSKRREGASGTLAGGKRFSRGALYTLLQNRTYRGDIVHKAQRTKDSMRRSLTKSYGNVPRRGCQRADRSVW
jgi:site-specific DNA recombinase